MAWTILKSGIATRHHVVVAAVAEPIFIHTLYEGPVANEWPVR